MDFFIFHDIQPFRDFSFIIHEFFVNKITISQKTTVIEEFLLHDDVFIAKNIFEKY